MNEVAAWLMQIDRLSKVAVGQLELIHIIAEPEYIDIPRAPEYCKRIVVWNNSVIPVFDLSLLINKTSAFYQHNAVAVALYSDMVTQKIKYGGIQLIDMPTLDKVTNKQHISEIEMPEHWRSISISGYRSKDNDVVPILNISRLFSTELALSA